MSEKQAGPTNHDLVLRLKALGALPGDDDPTSESFDYQGFDALLQDFETPVSAAEAQALLTLSPPAGVGAFGIEWALIHLIETLPLDELRAALADAPANEVTQTIRERVAREP